jgi:uncharacterized protein YndB with AHSA1/START domain
MEALRTVVSVRAPIDAVWSAWTSSERITAWFAPEANITAIPGGPFELFFDPDDHNHECTRGCVFTLVEPMHRLTFTWKGPSQFEELMNKADSLTSVIVSFEEKGGATQVVLDHRGWGDGEGWAKAKEWHRKAWQEALESLKSELERDARRQDLNR